MVSEILNTGWRRIFGQMALTVIIAIAYVVVISVVVSRRNVMKTNFHDIV